MLSPFYYDNFITRNKIKSYEDSIPSPSNSEISLLTPENRSYTDKTGYFLSAYDFEDIPLYSDSFGVIDELDEHKNVLKIKYGNGMYIQNQFSETFGSIEFYFRTEDATDRTVLSFEGDDTIPHIYFYIVDDNWYYLDRDVVDPHIINLSGNYTPQDNVWHHIRIDFDCRDSGGYLGLNPRSWKLNVDGNSSAELKIFRSSGSPPPCLLNKIYLFSEVEVPDGASYFDAFGFSWDIFYTLGENLNEGLPIIFRNTVPLDWFAYSLDGQADVQIPGNTSILMPANGSHSIKVTGRLGASSPYETTMVYFVVSPIEILTPSKNSIWEEESSYEINWITALNISHVDIEIYKGEVLKYSY